MTMKEGVYFHIHNGGITIAIQDSKDGPRLAVTATHFAHTTAGLDMGITKDDMLRLSEFFAAQAKRAFSPSAEWAITEPGRRFRAEDGKPWEFTDKQARAATAGAA